MKQEKKEYKFLLTQDEENAKKRDVYYNFKKKNQELFDALSLSHECVYEKTHRLEGIESAIKRLTNDIVKKITETKTTPIYVENQLVFYLNKCLKLFRKERTLKKKDRKIKKEKSEVK